ncbi:hypothetical protein NFI96_018165, partial [Prochilodus magdalenae]
MQKREMLKLMTAVALLISAPAMDAAPWVSEVPDLHQVSLHGGNNNGRSSGKKNKMVVTEGILKSTTVSSVASNGTSPRTSTDQVDPKLLNGKTFKKSFPSTTKKNNKR